MAFFFAKRKTKDQLWADLISDVRQASINATSSLHGEVHWRAVSEAGLMIPGSDPELCLAFGIIHDSMRIDDGWDPEHGLRAAQFARRSKPAQKILGRERMDYLVEACQHHEKGRVSRIRHIGACWDADRINLWRIAVVPNERFFSVLSGDDFFRMKTTFMDLWRSPASWDTLISRAMSMAKD